MRCDIIIPVWNQLAPTRDCISSIVNTTSYPYRLIVIDNASEAESASYLNNGLRHSLGSKVIVIRNQENLGFVKAVNQGIKQSDAPYVCIMNNDTIATNGWLEEMVAVMEARPDIGLLNPSSNTSGQFPEKGESFDDYASRLKKFKQEIQELYTCRGFCMLIKREVVERLGMLDEIYHMGYFDDTDYCKKAQREGFRTARAKAAYVYHLENTSFKELANNNELFKTNEQLFFKRWGRPLRIGYFVESMNSREKIDDIAIYVARSGHQIIIFLKKGLDWPVSLDHFDIRKVDINPIFFGILSIYKILKHKKRKKIEFLLTDSKLFGLILKLIKPLHGSGVMIEPAKDRITAMLNAEE